MRRLELHPVSPQPRLMKQIHDVYAADGLMVYPTDSGYSLGCNALSKKAVHRLYHLKRAIKKYLMALMVREFSQIAEFAKVDNFAFRYMKHLVPGPYTFILPATHRAKKTLDVNRQEVGIRMPDHPFLSALFALTPDPILNSAANIKDEDAFIDPDEIENDYGHLVDLIIDMGPLPIRPTTIISLVDGSPEVLRMGSGPLPEQLLGKQAWL